MPYPAALLQDAVVILKYYEFMDPCVLVFTKIMKLEKHFRCSLKTS